MKRKNNQKKRYMGIKYCNPLRTQIVPSNKFRLPLEGENSRDNIAKTLFSDLVPSLRKNILFSLEDFIKSQVLCLDNSSFESEYIYVPPVIDDSRKIELEMIDNENQTLGISLLLPPNEKKESYNPKEIFIPAGEEAITVTYAEPGGKEIKLICEISDLYIDENKRVIWFNVNLINDSFSLFGPIYQWVLKCASIEQMN